MAILNIAKKGFITIKTAAGYVKLLPRTLASLVEMNDGTSVEDKITELNSKLTGGYTHLTENIDGALALPNGLKLVYGSYHAYSMITDTAVGGYSVTIPLSKYGLVAPIFSNVAVRYPSGFPRAAIHSVTPDSIKIGCDVNIKNCYVQWMVIG